MVWRKFESLRGYAGKLISDNGAQLTVANEELRKVTKSWDWASWPRPARKREWNGLFFQPMLLSKKGTSEALVKSTKKVTTVVVGGSVMIFFNLQTMCNEAANLENERPIGKHPTSPEDGTSARTISRLGFFTWRVPSGSFRETRRLNRRFEFI